MPALVAGIHVFGDRDEDADGNGYARLQRAMPGHDEGEY